MKKLFASVIVVALLVMPITVIAGDKGPVGQFMWRVQETNNITPP